MSDKTASTTHDSAPSRRSRAARIGRRENGQAMVEFVLITPLLFLLLVGIIKFGILYNRDITLTDAVRSGARQLALGRGLPNPCKPAIDRTINAAAPSLNLNASQVTIVLAVGKCETNGDGTGSMGSGGDQATLSATYPCDLVILGVNFYPGCTLHATASEAIE